MPAIMTHDFFGLDAADAVSSQVNLISKDAHDAFMLGNQGPDPLFYLPLDVFMKENNRVGNLMHHARPARLMLSLHDALSMLTKAERPVGEAYAAGFVCHYLLDSSIHPLVMANQLAICDAGVDGLDRSDGDIVHAEIERDLDEMVLYAKRNETIATYRPYRKILKGSDAMLAIVDKLYFYMNLWTYNRTLELDAYTKAVKCFRIVQRALWSPNGRLSGALGMLEQAVKGQRYSLLKAMSHRVRPSSESDFANRDHRVWVNPCTQEKSTESFWDLYEDAFERIFDAQELFFSRDFGLSEARHLPGDLNFSGYPVDVDAMGTEE